MDTQKGYYIAPKRPKDFGATDKVFFEHDPSTEKQLFSISLDDLHQELNRDILGVEIGVLNGECSAHLLGIGEYIRLIGIDPIIPDSMETSLIGSEQLIKQNTEFAGDRWDFIKDYSTNQAPICPDDSLDFIFIDGDHTYDAVKNDYYAYKSKIKKGGLIYFHDSRMNRGGANFHVGSSKFVDEIIQANDQNLELIGEAFSLTCFKKMV